MSSSILTRSGNRAMLLAGTASLVGGFAYLIYKEITNRKLSETNLPKETIIKVLKEFKRDFLNLFMIISKHSNEYQKELKMKNPSLSDSELSEIVKDYYQTEESGLPQEIREIENRIYVKHDIINKNEFEKLYASISKKDNQVQELKEDIKKMCSSAILGRLEYPKITFPSSINSDLTLQTFLRIEKSILKKVSEILKLKQKNEDFQKSEPKNLKSDFLIFDVEKLKNEISENSGFNWTEDFFPFQLLTMAIFKFEATDEVFKKRKIEIENFKSQLKKSIFEGVISLDDIDREIELIEDILESKNGGIQNGVTVSNLDVLDKD